MKKRIALSLCLLASSALQSISTGRQIQIKKQFTAFFAKPGLKTVNKINEMQALIDELRKSSPSSAKKYQKKLDAVRTQHEEHDTHTQNQLKACVEDLIVKLEVDLLPTASVVDEAEKIHALLTQLSQTNPEAARSFEEAIEEILSYILN